MVLTIKDAEEKTMWSDKTQIQVYVLGGADERVWGYVGLVFIERDGALRGEPLD